MQACRRLLMALIATYVAQRCPVLCPLEGSPHWPQADLGGEAWEALRLEAVAPEQELRNEHAYKLCFLCVEQHKQQQNLPATDGSDSSAAGVSERLLYAAARKVLSAPLTGRDGEQPIIAATIPSEAAPAASPVSSPHIRTVRSV